uniref:Alpha/beta hydrolase family protein n=1 Tax=Candidatus Kentrum sp. LPFa TaxID=2126335 RepID=A0A450WWP1_9GAMM|nr:MAG: hypothetical protein BECKLPF1236B_GA0070989_12592 [Candidatus Kentron sp. LPFa]
MQFHFTNAGSCGFEAELRWIYHLIAECLDDSRWYPIYPMSLPKPATGREGKSFQRRRVIKKLILMIGSMIDPITARNGNWRSIPPTTREHGWRRLLPILVAFLSLPMLSACAMLSPLDYTEQADKRASAAGWRKQQLTTPYFELSGYVPNTKRPKREVLTIYIEGDGRAWLSTYRISPDPTPRNPLALALALRHPSDQAAAYLARPCQYDNRARRPPCRPEYWSGKRFAPEVIAASLAAVDRLKRRVGAERVVLIGYSGGGP